MKRYRAMRFVSGVIQFFGWLTIIFGILFCVVGSGLFFRIPSQPYMDQAAVLVISFVIGGLVVLCGVFIIAAGQLISAFANVARNSWYIVAIAANTQQSTEYFQRVSIPSRNPQIKV
jgi:uncharacterized membrane protein